MRETDAKEKYTKDTSVVGGVLNVNYTTTTCKTSNLTEYRKHS